MKAFVLCGNFSKDQQLIIKLANILSNNNNTELPCALKSNAELGFKSQKIM